MVGIRGLLPRLRAWMAVFLVVTALTAAHAAAAAEYVYDGLPDVKPEDRALVAQPQPVQLLFQFKTRGAPNARGTKYLRDVVVETVKNSGVFTDVSDGPTPNEAVLSVDIDNIAAPKDMQDAEGKGFTTGLTLFMAGNNVVDHFECTVTYVAGPGAPMITRKAQHAMITQIGLINKAPPHAVKVGAIKDAAFVMARQIVSNPLNDLAKDPGFAGGATPAASPLAPDQKEAPAASPGPPSPVQPSGSPNAAATPPAPPQP